MEGWSRVPAIKLGRVGGKGKYTDSECIPYREPTRLALGLNMGKTELLGSRVLASWTFYNSERHCQRYHPFPFYRVTLIYAH